MFRPSVRLSSARRLVLDLLCRLLTSACASRHLAMSVAQGTHADLPGYCALTFPLMPVGSTSQRSVQVSGFTFICLLTPLRRLYPLPVRQASALPRASFGFAVARDTLAVRLTLPLAGCVEDFHLQVRAPCRAHKAKKPSRCDWAFCKRGVPDDDLLSHG